MNTPPSTLGQYQIIREIARSNDIVYEAYDPLMNRRVAVKELAMPAGATPQQQEERIQRFRREAQAAGTLNHPNIMTVYSFAEDAGRTFMAMEYLDGHTLRNEIDTKGIIPAEEAVNIALNILRGLGHAHKKGVIHRDIKPENIQMLSNGEIKITDFGIARLTFQPNLTMDGQVFGTPSYMSPEQVVGKEIDARSDIFSCATVLYEMLAGQKPFAGDSVVSITYAIMNKEPVQPAHVPYKLWLAVQRALEKSPAARFASAEAFIAAIEEAMLAPASAPPVADPFGLSGQNVAALSVPPPPVAVPNPYAQNPHPVQQPGISYQPYGTSGAYAPHTYPATPPPPTYPNQPYPGQSYPGQSYPGQSYPGQVYQGQMGQGQPYPNSMPPPANLSQYYPPPPRTPLVNTEQWAFLKRLLITVVLVGTLLLLVTVAVHAIATALQRYAVEETDRKLVATAIQQDPRKPIGERIAEVESIRSRVSSATAKDELGRTLAVLYEELGKQHLSRREDPQAESAYLRASALDQHNAAHATNLAALYQSRAQTEPEPQQRIELLLQSGEQWEKAGRAERDRERRRQYFQQAALVYYTSAAEIVNLNDPTQHARARQALYSAQNTAEPASELSARIDGLLATLR